MFIIIGSIYTCNLFDFLKVYNLIRMADRASVVMCDDICMLIIYLAQDEKESSKSYYKYYFVGLR